MTYYERLRKAWEQMEGVDRKVAQLVQVLRDPPHPIFAIGNGGSQSTVQHLILHLRENRIPAFDLLADNAYFTMLANDYDYDSAPSRMPIPQWSPLFIVSGSGDSENLVRLLSANKERPAYALLGMGGGRVASQTNSIIVPSDDYGIIEDIHLSLVHMIAEGLRGRS